MGNKVYTAGWGTPSIAPLDLYGSNFEIFSALREMKIKSIHTVFDIINDTTGKRVGFESDLNQLQISLQVGNANTPFSKSFNVTSGSSINNFDTFMITRPDSFYFDSFFISERLEFSLACQNLDAVNNMRASIFLLVEIEEIVKF